jgi:hypothetical protein
MINCFLKIGVEVGVEFFKDIKDDPDKSSVS